ncbi:PaeR7I family type II restriction endonuclease [Amycolatopsis sp. NPDC005232]|uniref:PaeR7I family type II restriction endonuclease n=1 Tax=Amycolatopsis sp. NPDC005232 TaxID=3157027 RepID=UPI0033B805A9
MAIELSRNQIYAAVEDFWFKRTSQKDSLVDGGKSGGGARANGHLGTFTQLLADLFTQAGIAKADIKSGRPYLPGYYRARKEWDLVVTYRGHLLAAIELKSQVGGVQKNINNRFEEALGTATDTLFAQRKNQAFGTVPPWLGYVLVLEETGETEQKDRMTKALFPTDEEFNGGSYNDRYQIMLSRFLSDQVYNAGWFITTRNPSDGVDPSVTYSEPLAIATAEAFVAAIEGRINVVKAIARDN